MVSASARPPATSVPPTSAPAADTVDVDAGDYVGRPLAQVQAALIRQGLRVSTRPGRVQGVPDGRVLSVSPTGPVAVGDTVTVTFAAVPEAPGRSTPATSPPPSSSAPPRSSSASSSGAGDSDDQGGDGQDGQNGEDGQDGDGEDSGPEEDDGSP